MRAAPTSAVDRSRHGRARGRARRRAPRVAHRTGRLTSRRRARSTARPSLARSNSGRRCPSPAAISRPRRGRARSPPFGATPRDRAGSRRRERQRHRPTRPRHSRRAVPATRRPAWRLSTCRRDERVSLPRPRSPSVHRLARSTRRYPSITAAASIAIAAGSCTPPPAIACSPRTSGADRGHPRRQPP